ncbi:hypothetical protein DIPPA_33914 [Diplonema papillatum]|nr:hypothetical protein DIPPA_33914 [Diplonema papillatum]
MPASPREGTTADPRRLQAALAISKRELDREREETEILRARVLSLSEQLGAEQSRRERAERAARGPPSAADRSEDLRGRDALIAALQRQVDDDQHTIASLRTAAPLVVAPRGGAAPAKKSPLSPPPPRDADGSQRASSASGSPDRGSHRSPPKENGELALVYSRRHPDRAKPHDRLLLAERSCWAADAGSPRADALARENSQLRAEVREAKAVAEALRDRLQAGDRSGSFAAGAAADGEWLADRVATLEEDKSVLMEELRAVMSDLSDKRRLSEAVAEKAAEFAANKKKLLRELQANRDETSVLREQLGKLETDNERLRVRLEVELTARKTATHVARLYSAKVDDMLLQLSDAPSGHAPQIVNAHAAIFRQLHHHCDDADPYVREHRDLS